MNLIRFAEKITPAKIILIIVILGLITYFNTLFNGFVWDDEEEIVANPIVHSLSNINLIWSGATFNTGGAGLSGWFFRPLRTIFVMVNYSIWGANPFGFHLFHILTHIGVAIFLFRIILNLLKPTKFKTVIAGIISLLFVVHPANSEAVNYIASPDVLASFLALLFLYLLIKFQSKDLNAKKISLISGILMSSFLIKESALVIAPISVLYLYIFNSINKKIYSIVITSTFFAYFFIRLVLAQTPIRALDMSPIAIAPLTERLSTVPLTILLYLKIIFFPKYLAISQHFIIKEFTSLDFILPFLILLLTFSYLLYLSFYKKFNLSILSLIWIIFSFGLISNLLPLDMTLGERFLYFPHLGVSLLLADLLNRYINSDKKIVILIIITALILPILTVRTIIRNSNWYNGLTLYSHDYQINPDSYDIANNLGVELYRAGKHQEAKPLFEKSFQIFPKWYFAKNNLGAVYIQEKKYQETEKLFREVLSQTDYYLSHENLAQVLLLQKKYQEAEAELNISVQKLPNNPKLWFYYSITKYQLNKKEEALQAAANSYRISPSNQSAYLYQQIKDGKPLNLE